MRLKNPDDKTLTLLKALIFGLSLIPLGKLAFNAYLDNLGANPIEKVTHITGYWALSFLLITLSVTPLRRFSGWLWLIRLRRMLGLFSFFYAVLHFLTYLVLDQFFDWQAIFEDIFKRPYITVGFSVFLILIPLTITSSNTMMRKLGGRRWKKLHQLVYLCAIGGVVHFAWLVKKDLSNPVVFAVILGFLLGIRWFFRLKDQRKR